MKTHPKIRISQPCSENWEKMTPSKQGRFCDSCKRTVIDFSTMSSSAAQTYLANKTSTRVCGHIRTEKARKVHLKIPTTIVTKPLGFSRMFMFAFLLSMGTSLVSCNDENGTKHTLTKVELIDSNTNIEETDSTLLELGPNEYISVLGKVKVDLEDNLPITFFHVDVRPKFKDTPKDLSNKEEIKFFQQRINTLVKDSFNPRELEHLDLNPKTTYGIYARFTIDTLGKAKDIQTRANYPEMETQIEAILQHLPDLIPGKHEDKLVDVSYTIPIRFKPE